jgi:hypothetical protein
MLSEGINYCDSHCCSVELLIVESLNVGRCIKVRHLNLQLCNNALAQEGGKRGLR